MSLREEILTIIRGNTFECYDDKIRLPVGALDEIINKVLDNAIEELLKVRPVSWDLHESTNELYYMHDIKQAILALKEMKDDNPYKKAAMDAFMYGCGFIYIDDEGAHYVDPRDVVIEPEDAERDRE